MRSRRLLRLLGLSAALLIRAPARVPAWAQFSTPYDADFAPEKAEEPEAPAAAPSAPAAPEEAPQPAVLAPSGTGPFLLIDRPDKDHILEQAPPPQPEEKPLDFLDFERKLRPFQYSQDQWNTMRRHASDTAL